MANREHLRAWCNDTRPADDFTIDQNRDDLAAHVEEAEEGFAYGYTIWDPSGSLVLGSVYLYPAAFFAGRYKMDEASRARLEFCGVLVDYWLDETLELDSAFSEAFVRELQRWLREAWGFSALAWATRPQMANREQLYQAVGFSRQQTCEAIHTPGWYQTFHISDA